MKQWLQFLARLRPRLSYLALCGCLVACGASVAMGEDLNKPSEQQLDFFEKKIRPLFVENCYICHSEHHKEAGGLRVDDFRALTLEGKNGAAVVPGHADKSILIKRVAHPDDTKIMPPDHRLSEQQVADLKKWIDDGAAWPALVIPEGIDQSLDRRVVHEELKKSHWAWQPLQSVAVPNFDAAHPLAGWVRNDVDKFIAHGLDQRGLKPVKDASKAVLLRRLTYDLTGLPPTEEDLLAFSLDESDKATETVVDKLLSSKAFGERWGRHWLDLARYGESTGSARNLPYPHAWRYRDYVIDSFNNDKPYNLFLQEQLAGDQLPASSLAQKRDQLVATGFLALGVKDVNQRFKVRYDMDNVDEQIDTVSRAVIGLTVSCARCHDHKFDPVSTQDYYALAGIFTSTELCDALRNQMGGGGLAYYVPARLLSLSESGGTESTPELEQEIERKKAEVEVARQAFTTIRDSVKQADRGPEHAKKLQQARQAMQKKQAELVALTDPAKRGPVALGVRDVAKPADTEIRIRGEAEKLGPSVPRRFLSVLDHLPSQAIPPGRSGRYELAMWLTEPSNPLTTRVVVNRIWQHLFGEGIVNTVDNFGVTGGAPSHPELLDHLANKFVQDGWSFKKLIRELVLSRTYQLSSASSPEALAVDPANKLQWRHSPRRLEAEEIRDSILALAGQLAPGRPATSPASELPVIEIRNNGPEARNILSFAAQSKHRSVYLPLVRGILPGALEVFDFAEQGMVTGKRTNTTVAPQALFMLNDAFVRAHAQELAQQLHKTSAGSVESQVAKAYRLILNRQPTGEEARLAVAFLSDYKSQFAQLQTPTSTADVVASNAAESESAPAATNPTANTAAGDKSSNASSQRAQATNASAPVVPVAAPEDSRDSEFNPDSIEVKAPQDPELAAIAALVQSLWAGGEFRYIR